jgi:hypothetical protein
MSPLTLDGGGRALRDVWYTLLGVWYTLFFHRLCQLAGLFLFSFIGSLFSYFYSKHTSLRCFIVTLAVVLSLCTMMDTPKVLPLRCGTLPSGHREACAKRIPLKPSVHLLRPIKQLSLVVSNQAGGHGNSFDRGLASCVSEASWGRPRKLNTKFPI